MSTSHSYNLNANEPRHRCFSTGNHSHGGSTTTISPDRHHVDASPSSAATVLLTGHHVSDDVYYADEKYDKNAKTRSQQQQKRRRRLAKQQVFNRLWKQTTTHSTATQMVGLAMILTALMTVWHCSRGGALRSSPTSSRVFRQLQQQHDQDHAEMMYQLAAERIHEIHQDERDDRSEGWDMKAKIREQQWQHEQEKREERLQQQQQQQRQQQGSRDHDGTTPQERRPLSESEGTTVSNTQRDRRQERQGIEPRQTATEKLLAFSIDRLQEMFLEALSKKKPHDSADSNDNIYNNGIRKILMAWIYKVNQDIVNNAHGGVRWIMPTLLPPLPDDPSSKPENNVRANGNVRGGGGQNPRNQQQTKLTPNEIKRNYMFFQATREQSSQSSNFTWEHEWEQMLSEQESNEHMPSDEETISSETKASQQTARIARKLSQPIVDYTAREKYSYPRPLLETPPEQGGYPQMSTLGSLMENWDQDEDFHGTITETLVHFNFSNPDEVEMARKFRDAELPFKLYDVHEIAAANLKWTDEYMSKQFDDRSARGLAEESPNHYFAYFTREKWRVESLGVPPVRKNLKWSWNKWSHHARYADAVRLSPDQPHFYWQSGVTLADEHGTYIGSDSFISRDLPSFSSSTESFFMFQPEKQMGIECRFGERGTVISNHYDAGRNMVGMITGAKRYILSPPKMCSKLGVTTTMDSPIFRQSVLDLGHLKYLNSSDLTTRSGEGHMSERERSWLERAAQADAVETVLKEGEVLYIPSFWFHYIIGLQKSAQCNVRSGVSNAGTSEFGGEVDVLQGNC